MAKQMVNKKNIETEGQVFIFQLPDSVNVIQPTKMSKPIFVPNKVIEIDSTDTVLLNHVRGIEGASDITDAIEKFRGE